MKKLLKKYKKEKIKYIVNNYNNVLLLRYPLINDKKLIYKLYDLLQKKGYIYRIKGRFLSKFFLGQGQLLFIYLNNQNLFRIKNILNFKNLHFILFKNFFIFSKIKINNLFNNYKFSYSTLINTHNSNFLLNLFKIKINNLLKFLLILKLNTIWRI